MEVRRKEIKDSKFVITLNDQEARILCALVKWHALSSGLGNTITASNFYKELDKQLSRQLLEAEVS